MIGVDRFAIRATTIMSFTVTHIATSYNYTHLAFLPMPPSTFPDTNACFVKDICSFKMDMGAWSTIPTNIPLTTTLEHLTNKIQGLQPSLDHLFGLCRDMLMLTISVEDQLTNIRVIVNGNGVELQQLLNHTTATPPPSITTSGPTIRLIVFTRTCKTRRATGTRR